MRNEIWCSSRARLGVLGGGLLVFSLVLEMTPLLAQVRRVEYLQPPGPGVGRIATWRTEIPPWEIVGDVDGDGVRDWLMRSESDDGWDTLLVHGVERPETAVDVRSMPHTVIYDPEVWLGNSQPYGDAGDVDGDGLADFLIGLAGLDTGDKPGAGGAILVFGTREFPAEFSLTDMAGSGLRHVLFVSDEEGAGVGRRVGNAGDLNGDARTDLVLASDRAAGSADGLRAGGRLYVVYGGFELEDEIDLGRLGDDLDGFVLEGAFGSDRASGHPNGDRLTGGGFIVAGDLNGDGVSDLVVSAPNASRGFEQAGAVYVVYGSTEIPDELSILAPEAFGVEFQGARELLRVGESLAAVGDVDDDGLADFVAGAPGALQADLSGIAYLIYGSRGWPRSISVDDDRVRLLRIHGTTPTFAGSIPFRSYHGFLGNAAAGIGDWNRDGFDDFAVAAFREVVEFEQSIGAVYVVFGGPELPRDIDDSAIGTPEVPGIQITRPGSDNGLGNVLHGVDADGDGVRDLVISSGFAPLGEYTEHVYILHGEVALAGGLRLDAVIPASGSRDGGSSVRVLGNGFRGDEVVLFGGVASPSVRVLNSAELHAEIPPRDTTGVVDVEVRSGQGSVARPAAFRYIGPRLLPEIRLDELGFAGGEYRSMVIENPTAHPFLDREFSRSFFGDLDGDGIDDLVISAAYEGELLIVFGGDSLPEATSWSGGLGQTRIRSGDPTLDLFGASIALPGDLDDDGLGELAVGGYTPDQTLSYPGTAYIVFGRRVWDTDLILSEDEASGRTIRIRHDRCGVPALSGAGALAASGKSALLVGRRFPCSGAESTIDLYLDGIDAEGPPAPSFTLGGDPTIWPVRAREPETTSLGTSLAGLGDINGDGSLDFLAGSDDGGGQAFLVLGGSWVGEGDGILDRIDSGRAVRLRRYGTITYIGYGAERAGDFNGDGFADALLSDAAGGRDAHGEVFVVFGSPELGRSIREIDLREPSAGLLRLEGEDGGDAAAFATGVGDWNDDGFDDIGIVSLGIRNQEPRAYIVYGRPDPPQRVSLADLGDEDVLRIFAAERHWLSGGTGGIATGDLDGDGFEDIAIGAGGFDGSRTTVIFGQSARPAQFIRGDANRDGKVELSDAVFILGYLFLGQAALRCSDAGDADDSGVLDLSDAIVVLNHLFLGGSAPPAPYPDAGADPTDDALECRR